MFAGSHIDNQSFVEAYRTAVGCPRNRNHNWDGRGWDGRGVDNAIRKSKQLNVFERIGAVRSAYALVRYREDFCRRIIVDRIVTVIAREDCCVVAVAARHVVGPGAAVQPVVAAAAVERVSATIADQRVVAVESFEIIGSVVADQKVFPGRALDVLEIGDGILDGPGNAENVGVPGVTASLDEVDLPARHPRSEPRRCIGIAHPIDIGAAIQGVYALPAIQDVVAAATVQPVVAAAAVERVGATIAGQYVVAVESFEMIVFTVSDKLVPVRRAFRDFSTPESVSSGTQEKPRIPPTPW